MATVLERVHHLVALSASPNENEARNAAVLAVALIRKHALVISMPARTTPSATRAETTAASARRTSSGGMRRQGQAHKTPGSKRVKRVADSVEKIVSPLGGECIHCGQRYKAKETVYWFASGGGMHQKCFDDWSRKA
jgi:hypothetical protein